MKSNMALLRESEENLEWLHENYKEIQKRFENKIIAIHDKKIVASATNSETLLKHLKKKGIDSSEVLIEVITAKNEIYILWKG